jgi:hypothetical protein
VARVSGCLLSPARGDEGHQLVFRVGTLSSSLPVGISLCSHVASCSILSNGVVDSIGFYSLRHLMIVARKMCLLGVSLFLVGKKRPRE